MYEGLTFAKKTHSRVARVQVVITAFNHGTHDESRIPDSVLSELCDADGRFLKSILFCDFTVRVLGI